MKSKLYLVFSLLFLFSLTVSSESVIGDTPSGTIAAEKSEETPQSAKKPKYDYDYMSSFLARNTKPLGLKDNAPLRKFLNQPSIHWALRAGGRHILN